MHNAQILTEGLLFPEGPLVQSDGSLLVVEVERKTVTRIRPDGDKCVIADLGGGPNGLAMGPDGYIYVCNNGGFLFRDDGKYRRVRPGVPEGYAGGWIEKIQPQTGHHEVLYTTCGERHFSGPNDIVFDDKGGFYFTDYGKTYPRFRDYGGLYYGLADGSRITEVAFPMISPNGVGMSPDLKVVYVAETETSQLWAFDIDEPGAPRRHPFPSPHGGRLVCSLPGYQRFDSLAVEAGGNICVATLITGCITVINPDGKIVRQVDTNDPVTTNICFGGDDFRTAYITLSGTGKLMVTQWEEPGLRLVHSPI